MAEIICRIALFLSVLPAVSMVREYVRGIPSTFAAGNRSYVRGRGISKNRQNNKERSVQT